MRRRITWELLLLYLEPMLFCLTVSDCYRRYYRRPWKCINYSENGHAEKHGMIIICGTSFALLVPPSPSFM